VICFLFLYFLKGYKATVEMIPGEISSPLEFSLRNGTDEFIDSSGMVHKTPDPDLSKSKFKSKAPICENDLVYSNSKQEKCKSVISFYINLF